MKVIYELDYYDDADKRKSFAMIDRMQHALYALDELIRQIDKGYQSYTLLELLEAIESEIDASGIRELQ